MDETIEVKMVFTDWFKRGMLANNADLLQLTAGDFHGGSTFPGSIVLSQENADELREAMGRGFRPVFWLSLTYPATR